MTTKSLPNITPWVITGICITLSTAMAWVACRRYDLGLEWSLLFVPSFFLCWRIFYYACNKAAEKIIKPFDKAHHSYVERKQKEAVEEAIRNIQPTVIIKTPGEDEANARFKEQCDAENNIISEQISREETEKLEKILVYAQDTLLRLNFTEGESAQVLECVKYFVSHKRVLNADAMRIQKKPDVNQASLKNFAWNIANQYGIDGTTTAVFVKTTFQEWFSNTEVSSIIKTLRNINGAYAVEIDDNILR